MALHPVFEIVFVFADDASVDVEDIGNVVGLAIANADPLRHGPPAIEDDEVILLVAL